MSDTNKIIDSTGLDAVSKFTEYTDRLFNTFEQIVNTYSDPAKEAVLSIIRLEAVFNIVITIIFLIVMWVCRSLLNTQLEERHEKALENSYYIGEWAFTKIVINGIIYVSTLVLIVGFLSFSKWLAIYDPKLFLVKRLMDKVI